MPVDDGNSTRGAEAHGSLGAKAASTSESHSVAMAVPSEDQNSLHEKHVPSPALELNPQSVPLSQTPLAMSSHIPCQPVVAQQMMSGEIQRTSAFDGQWLEGHRVCATICGNILTRPDNVTFPICLEGRCLTIDLDGHEYTAMLSSDNSWLRWKEGDVWAKSAAVARETPSNAGREIALQTFGHEISGQRTEPCIKPGGFHTDDSRVSKTHFTPSFSSEDAIASRLRGGNPFSQASMRPPCQSGELFQLSKASTGNKSSPQKVVTLPVQSLLGETDCDVPAHVVPATRCCTTFLHSKAEFESKGKADGEPDFSNPMRHVPRFSPQLRGSVSHQADDQTELDREGSLTSLPSAHHMTTLTPTSLLQTRVLDATARSLTVSPHSFAFAQNTLDRSKTIQKQQADSLSEQCDMRQHVTPFTINTLNLQGNVSTHLTGADVAAGLHATPCVDSSGLISPAKPGASTGTPLPRFIVASVDPFLIEPVRSDHADEVIVTTRGDGPLLDQKCLHAAEKRDDVRICCSPAEENWIIDRIVHDTTKVETRHGGGDEGGLDGRLLRRRRWRPASMEASNADVAAGPAWRGSVVHI